MKNPAEFYNLKVKKTVQPVGSTLLIENRIKINPRIKHFYNEVITNLRREILDKRINDVRSGLINPNYNKKVY